MQGAERDGKGSEGEGVEGGKDGWRKRKIDKQTCRLDISVPKQVYANLMPITHSQTAHIAYILHKLDVGKHQEVIEDIVHPRPSTLQNRQQRDG